MVREVKKEAILLSKGPLIKKGVLLSHSRIFNPARPDLKSSEVWTDIGNGARWRARKLGVGLTIYAPESYHDVGEALDLLDFGIKKKRPDAVILPDTPLPGSNLEKKLLDIVCPFGGKVGFVNVPANERVLKQVGNKAVGYAGMNEFGAGQKAARSASLFITEEERLNGLVVLKHEEGHYGHWLRIQGIRDIAGRMGIPVKEVFVGTENQKPLNLGDGKFTIITLGNRGTEAALTLDPERIAGLVGMDLNPTVAQAILDSRVNSTLIQYPRAQGILAIDLMFTSGGFQNYFCGPTIVDPDNVRVFQI